MARTTLQRLILAFGLMAFATVTPALAQSRAEALAALEKASAPATKTAAPATPTFPAAPSKIAPLKEWQKLFDTPAVAAAVDAGTAKPDLAIKPWQKPETPFSFKNALKPAPVSISESAKRSLLDGGYRPTDDPVLRPFLLPTRPTFDITRYPGERKIVFGWKSAFPDLVEFEVQGPGTDNPSLTKTRAGTYNCIAHTAGIKNYWVNPFQTGIEWDKFYAPFGYKPASSLDTSTVAGKQKVAIYATRKDGNLEYTHAAVQEADGTWTSKLGSGPLIRHRTAEDVCGPTYGEVVRVYVRSR